MRALRMAVAALVGASLLLSFSGGGSAPPAFASSGSTGLITHNKPADNGDEVLLIRLDYNGNYEQFRQEMIAAATPNATRRVQTIAPAGITDLSVSSNYFGVIVEPVAGSNYVIDLVGVNDPDRVTVESTVTGNRLSVTVHGDRNESMLLSTVPGNRINTVRVGVPAGTLQTLQLHDEKNSCILVKDLDVPLTATVGSGTARVQKDQLSAAIAMECTSGDLIVQAQQVTEPVTLTTSSGDVSLRADLVTGHATLTASSGDVTVEAGTLHNAVLRATSGDVNATVTHIVGSVQATVSSGDLSFALTRALRNLRFVFDGNEADEDVTLPRGWTDGYRVGNGKPVLHLGVGSGELELTVG